LLLGLSVLAGCAPFSCRPSASAGIEAELLFGLSIAGGGTVSAAAFGRFVADEIAPRFPAGFTVLAGEGGWRGSSEGARLVVIAAPDVAATYDALNAVRAAYRARFRQQSVGLITVRSCADFGPGEGPGPSG
jgi:hypothetical protein